MSKWESIMYWFAMTVAVVVVLLDIFIWRP